MNRVAQIEQLTNLSEIRGYLVANGMHHYDAQLLIKRVINEGDGDPAQLAEAIRHNIATLAS